MRRSQQRCAAIGHLSEGPFSVLAKAEQGTLPTMLLAALTFPPDRGCTYCTGDHGLHVYVVVSMLSKSHCGLGMAVLRA